jgi:hypothetical protein
MHPCPRMNGYAPKLVDIVGIAVMARNGWKHIYNASASRSAHRTSRDQSG